MAFSMFLRNSACTNRAFSQQVMRLATQSLTQHSAACSLPISISNLTLKNTNTPLMNAVRPLRTSTVSLADPLMPHNEKAHDHSKLWVIERVTSAALVPLIPLALAFPNKILDTTLAILITAHTFWGLEAIMVEYVRVLLFGTLIPKIAMLIVYICTAVMLGGMYFAIFNDIGLARAFWRIWLNMRKQMPLKNVKKCSTDADDE